MYTRNATEAESAQCNWYLCEVYVQLAETDGQEDAVATPLLWAQRAERSRVKQVNPVRALKKRPPLAAHHSITSQVVEVWG